MVVLIGLFLFAQPDTSKLSKEKILKNPKYEKVERVNLTGSRFQVLNKKEYKEVAVTVVDERFVPVRHFAIKNFNGKNVEWDFKDQYGNEVPDGQYTIIVSITYTDGSKSTKYISVKK